MKSKSPESGCCGVRTRRVLLELIITIVVLSVAANFVILRQSQNMLADGNALQLLQAPRRRTQLVQELVPLSPNEEFVRVGGYRTVRVDITNRVKGYSRSANLSQGQLTSWNYSGRFFPSDLNVRGALAGDEVFAIMKAVDTNIYGRIQTILMINWPGGPPASLMNGIAPGQPISQVAPISRSTLRDDLGLWQLRCELYWLLNLISSSTSDWHYFARDSSYVMNAADLVEILIEGDNPSAARSLIEASVRLSTRGKRFNASFRDETARQVWKSTGLTDRAAALALATAWERDSQLKRVSGKAAQKKPTIRVKPGGAESAAGLFSQAEVGLILGVSERAIREIERRAFAKLRNHPALRQFWHEWQSGDVKESTAARANDGHLSRDEIAAVYNLAKTSSEYRALEKLFLFVGSSVTIPS